MSDQPLSYAFSYGFVGGPLHARKFKRLMNKAGYTSSLTPQKAEIIIAHSAGCWLIPRDCKPKLVVYVGMPLAQSNPRQTLVKANRQGLKNGQPRDWMPTRMKSTFYGLSQPVRNVNIMRIAKQAEPVILGAPCTVFIANQRDPWPIDAKLQNFQANQDWAFIGLPGSHNDVWQNPDLYVEIINHYARLLA